VDVLDAVQILLAAENEGQATNVEIAVFDQLPTGTVDPICASVMRVSPPGLGGYPEWYQFHFGGTIPLTPGETYYLAARELTYEDNVQWWRCSNDDNYTSGTAWQCTGPGSLQQFSPPFDFAFQTEYYGTATCGDVDASGGVDIDDVVYLICFIFAECPPPDPYESGDVDCSGGVDIDDVVYLINYIFVGGPAPCDPDGDDVPDC
jgi:hypothetical protein